MKKEDSVTIIAADVCTFSYTGVTHEKEKIRNNLTSTQNDHKTWKKSDR